jgi:predicted kinase
MATSKPRTSSASRTAPASSTPSSSTSVSAGEGIYTPAHTDATYGELLRRTGRALALGESVILDASWTSTRWRNEAEALARAASADLTQFRCTCPHPVADARLLNRYADVSDATPAVAAAPGPAQRPLASGGVHSDRHPAQ